MSTSPLRPADYSTFLEDITSRIRSARTTAARLVNRELVLLYWDLGREIVERQERLGWGDSVVETLAADLRNAFPDIRGFSSQNLWRIKKFYLTHSAPELLAYVDREIQEWRIPSSMQISASEPIDPEILAQAVRELVASVPWGHHANVLATIDDPAARIYYLNATARFGWTRNVLLNQIKAGAYQRSVVDEKSHNFPNALPERHAEQAVEMMKSSYNLEFLGIGREMKERDLENGLIDRLHDFILELGYGFCFIGR